MILRSLLRRNGASDSMMTGSSSTNDYGDKQAFLGKEDLATFVKNPRDTRGLKE